MTQLHGASPPSAVAGAPPLLPLAAACALALVVRVALGAREVVMLDRIFLPDDTYYTLTIARNLARGLGPTADGTILTSGFQPLIAFLLMPVFWLTNDLAVPIFAAVAVSALFGVLNTAMVGLIVRRATESDAAALFAMIAVATASVVVKNDLNGLEGSLAAFLSLLAVHLASTLPAKAQRGSLIRLGACCGLTLLARIDTCFVVFLIGLWCLWKAGIRATAIVALTALAVVSPWWLFCLFTFGSVVPESGAAVKQVVSFHQDLHLTREATLIRVRDTITRLVGLDGTAFSIDAARLVLAAGAYPLVRAVFRRRVDAAAVLSLAGLTAIAFYVFYLPAFWFFERYFALAYLCLVIGLATLLSDALGWFRAPAMARAVVFGLATLAMIGANLPELAHLRSSPQQTLFTKDQGARGYGEIARELVAALPDGATLATMQSGAIGYYAQRAIRVVNLDGVVNGRAHRALMRNELLAYARSEGAGYFADWDFNIMMFQRHSGVEDVRRSLQPLLQAKAQQSDRFALYRIAPPDVRPQ